MAERKVKVKLERDMIFKCDLGDLKMDDCYIDETNTKESEMVGPNAAHLLGMAVLGCLSSSYIFCFNKKNFTIQDLEAEAIVTIYRNEKGFVRVKKIDVTINPKIDSPKMRKRAAQCQKMFERYCTITASVRDGVDVNVNIDLK
ncbi:MAG: OsmC family protein [Candidatus Thorarchaeota archaeon]